MRIVKKVLLYTTIIAVSILAILVVFGFLFQDRIVSAVKAEINKNLNSEIKVDEITFSFISHFPLASVNMNNVTGFESSNFSATPDSLFHFENLSLSFNILDVIESNLILQSITVNEGFVNLEIDKNGQENYFIIKSDTSNTSNFFLNLEQVNLENCIVNFRDFRTKDQYGFYFPAVIARGTFSSEQIATSLYGQTRVNALILDGTPYLTAEEGNVDVGIEINLETGQFQVSRGLVTLREKYDFEIKGKSNNGIYQYTFKATDLDLSQAETLIPKKHIKFINAYQIDGKANILIELSKLKSANHPSITGSFDVWEGDFKNKNSKVSVQIEKAKGRFDLGKLATTTTTQIWVDEFMLITKEGRASGKVSLSNLVHPWYRIETSGIVDLLELSKLVSFGNEFSMQGIADFELKMTGSIQQIDSITPVDLKSIKGRAKIQLEKGGFVIPNVPSIDSVQATILLNQDLVVIERFTGNVANSITMGSLKARNWLRYAIDQTLPIDVSGNLNTQKIETSKWVSKNSSTEEQKFSFPDKVTFYGHIDAHEFIHENTYLTNISTNITYEPHKLRLYNTRFSTLGGDVMVDFSMNQRQGNFVYDANLMTKNINVQDLLRTYNNFGQTAVTYKHLRGDLNSQLKLHFASNREFKMDNNSIVATGDIMLVNGEMIENELLTSIPAEIESNKILKLFINLDEFEKRLRHIKFDTLQNIISVKNSVLTIPQMHISSSALQIDVSGTHSFTNEVDYYLSFNLNEVLTKKKRVISNYGFIQDDELGNRMMFLHLYTKNGKFEVDLDKEGSRKYRSARSSEEVKVAKSVLKEEFGFFENDTSIVTTKENNEFEYELDLGEFGEDSSSMVKIDTNTVGADSSKTKKQKKKKSKKEKETELEEFDFEDDDY